jgi:hypothetical protein
MSIYKIPMLGRDWHYCYYRVQKGVVEKWQPRARKWKKSALYASEEQLMKHGAIETDRVI